MCFINISIDVETHARSCALSLLLDFCHAKKLSIERYLKDSTILTVFDISYYFSCRRR